LRYETAKSTPREKIAKALDEFIIPLEVVSFNEDAAHVYGDIRANLEKAGTPIGAMDMLIAAHALLLGIPLGITPANSYESTPSIFSIGQPGLLSANG